MDEKDDMIHSMQLQIEALREQVSTLEVCLTWWLVLSLRNICTFSKGERDEISRARHTIEAKLSSAESMYNSSIQAMQEVCDELT